MGVGETDSDITIITVLICYSEKTCRRGSKRGLVEIRRCGYEATGGAVSSQWFGEVGAQVGKNQSIEASMLYDQTYRSTWIRMDDHT